MSTVISTVTGSAWLSSTPLVASAAGGVGSELGSNPISTVLLLALLTLVPFILMMTTSFLKFAVVLSILRTAMGTQQVPPTPVVMGLSVVLSMYVMAPVGREIYAAIEEDLSRDQQVEVLSPSGARTLLANMEKGREPMRRFLERHARHDDVQVFLHYSTTLMAPDDEDPTAAAGEAAGAQPPAALDGPPADEPQADDLLVLIPAFAISELAEAFAIGFALFLPFLVIDMVVANILLAMGMHMLSPVVVSLPFKLLLFVMIDGWRMVTQGLLMGYMG